MNIKHYSPSADDNIIISREISLRKAPIHSLIPFILGMMSIFIGVLLFPFGTNTKFPALFLLPLFTGIIIIFQTFFINTVKGMSIKIIGGMYFIRNVIAPLVLVLDGFQSKFNGIGDLEVKIAVYIMTYETIIVAISVVIISNSINKKQRKASNTVLYAGDLVYKAALIIGIIIAAYALMGSLELRSIFYSIFTPNFYEVGNNVINSTSSKALYNGGKVLIDSLRFVIPITIIVYLRNRFQSSKKVLFLSVIIAVSQVLFMTDGNAYILILVIIQLILIFRIHNKYRNEIKRIIVLFGLCAAFLMAIHRFLLTDSAYSSSISVFLQSYFGGVCDVAGIFRMQRDIPLQHMIIDYYSAVPFRSTLFGYSGNAYLTVQLYNLMNGAHSQILPTISEGYYFFGFLLSPILSVILVYIAISFENKAKSQNHYLYYSLDMLVSLIAAISPIAYDMRIFLTYCLNNFIFMWFFIRLSKGCPKYIIEGVEE